MAEKTGGRINDLFKSSSVDNPSVLVIGPPKCGKTLLGMHFLFEGLNNDEHGIFIITNNFPEDVMKRFERLGKIDHILSKGKLKFIDCYSIHAGIEKKNTIFIIRVNGPTALSEIGIAFSKILTKIPKKGKVRAVFDSISTLLMFNPPNQVVDFVQQLNSKAKKSCASALFILEEGMHDQKDVIALNSLLDVMIRLKSEKSKNIIEFVGVGAPDPMLYTIEDGKMRIVDN